MNKLYTYLIWGLVISSLILAHEDREASKEATRVFSVPMAEVLQAPIYLSQNEFGETVVRAVSKGSDFVENDYLTHADDVRILNGGLDSFIKSGEKEVVVPVIDDEADSIHGEGKLLGFVMLTSVMPRKLHARRGEIVYDLEEGGAPPSLQVGNIVVSSSGVMNTEGKDYEPPPQGGGACITDRDCYFGKGTCVGGLCQCEEPLTGSYCQLYRPDRTSLSPVVKKQQEAESSKFHSSVNENKLELQARALKRREELHAELERRGRRRDEFGFTFGNGPRLETPLPRGPEEVRHLRASVSTGGGSGGPGSLAGRIRGNLQGNTVPTPAPAPASSSDSSDSTDFIKVDKPTERAETIPTLAELQRESAKARSHPEAAKEGPNPKAKMKMKVKVKAKPKPKVIEESEKIAAAGSQSTTTRSTAAIDALSPAERRQLGFVEVEEFQKPRILQQYEQGDLDMTDARVRLKVDKARREEEAQLVRIEDQKRRNKEAASKIAGAEATRRDQEEFQQELKKIEQTEPDKRIPAPEEQPKRPMASMADLYGVGKAYPEPYAAGKVPPELIHARHKARHESRKFIFSVRYRNGPLGLSFDNKHADKTVVERVGKSMQSDLSDVQVGDRVLAVDQYNVSNAPAKITQRIMSSLSWPRVVVFEVKGDEGVERLRVQESLQQRSLNLTALYPPSLFGVYAARTPEWTPLLGQDFNGSNPASTCPVFFARSSRDAFGCEVPGPGEYALPSQAVQLARQYYRDTGRAPYQGWGSAQELEVEDDPNTNYYEEHAEAMPMLSMLLQEAAKRQIVIALHSMVITKRGMCTFITKSAHLRRNGASVGLVVNNEESLSDMQKGRGDDSSHCDAPTAIISERAGTLIQHTASLRGALTDPKAHELVPNEVLLIAGEEGTLTAACERVHALSEELTELWPHSVPAIPTAQLLSQEQKLTVSNHQRPQSEEGGRLAVAGDNGWAFFDYHLAMFGPQEVPLGPHRMQMALPPHGCDPDAYQVRIRDTVVAILRGGGCSFGIKVINAQKLGAKAVVIVNTDESKNMRLMALPDEEPQIDIPCIMVSRRIQYYLEGQLRRFYANDQHIVSLQPTGVFGDYEERSQAVRKGRLG